MSRLALIRRLIVSASALLAAAALSLAGNPGPNPGPDVTVGDIPDGTSYGTVGTTNIYAFDLGTTACNNGNVNIRWQASTPNHPVIAQNVYRYLGGRFEQIGMSWVKHGFYASTQSYCSTCNQQGGTVLGVGCSDPYDTGLNGEQAGLGPRSEINASTGVFPYVYPHPWPPVVNALSRRIQISGDDLAPASNPGAQYFGEGIYITADDASAGDGWNDASWRPVSFDSDPSAYTLSVGGAAHRTEPAIFAWKCVDPSVRLAAMDIPGDGRFWLGHSVTQNPDGTWHYEYALFNLNSDRSAGGFSIPIPVGTTVTNAAFKALPCHSGEAYSNAPWTIAFDDTDALAFSVPQTFAQNPNSSALRWGTMCNFRFDADTAPGDGSVSTILFKPGPGPSAFVLGARTPGGISVSAPLPVNDMCPGALPLHAGENRLSNFGAGDVSAISCSPIAADLWYTFTFNAYAPGCTGNITIDTCGSEIDTALIVYAGTSCSSTPASEVACAASGPGASCAGPKGAATVTFAATDGDSFLVRVGSPSATQGNIVLNVSVPFCIAPMGACCAANGSCSITPGPASCFTGTFNAAASACNPNPCSLPPPPINDQCSGAIPIGDSAIGWPTLLGTNYQADNTVNDICNFGSSGVHDVWYIYRPAQSGPVAIDTCIVPPSGISLDTILNLHAGSCTGPVVDCNDDAYGFCVPGSRIMPTLDSSITYYIRVCGYGTATGDFVLRVYGGGGKPVGACCWGAGCSITAPPPAACTGPNTSFAGLSTTCNPGFNNFSPCCRADYNHNGVVAVQDIFAYLSDWFLTLPSAVFGGNGDGSHTPDVQDIFRFLAAWFAGCP